MAVKLSVPGETPDVKSAIPWVVTVENNGDGSVDVGVSTDGETHEWVIFKLKADGTFYRYADIGSDSGFKIDKNGRITETKAE